MGSAGGYALGMREPQFIQSELAPVGTLAACSPGGTPSKERRHCAFISLWRQRGP